MKKKLQPYKGKRLKLTLGIGQDSTSNRVKPVKSRGVHTCNYCTISCENDPNYPEELFYILPIKIGETIFMTTACAFCAQSRYMNTIGDSRGEIYIGDYLSQNNVIMIYIAASAAGFSAQQKHAALTNHVMSSPDENAEEIPAWTFAMAQCAAALNTLKGVMYDDLIKFNSKAQPTVEQRALVSFLQQQPPKEYVNVIRVINRYFRYIPRENKENRLLVEYFAEHAIEPKYPIEKWADIAELNN